MESSISNLSPLRSVARRLRARFAAVNWLVERTRLALAWLHLLQGALVHWASGRTPNRAHHALVELFVRTDGRANDTLARMIGVLHPPYGFERCSGVLGELSAGDLTGIQQRLQSDGYCVFESCLPEAFCERLVKQSLEFDCLVLGDEMATRPQRVRKHYRRDAAEAPKYLLTEEDTCDIAEIQQLLCDESLIQVAQNYLGAKPIFTGLSLWWSAPYQEQPDVEAAQKFHFDMERIRWLRYFIYLTDVSADRGPHCFIRGTHRSGAIPREVLREGYVRQEDDRLLALYGREAYREFVGPRGTIIAEDSRGFHKGLPPMRGDRLLLAFEMSSSTFGANKRYFIRNVRVPKFGQFAKRYPRLYSNFDFREGLL